MRAFTDPKASPVGETTFMVEDYVPESASNLTYQVRRRQIKPEVPVELKVDGHFLYGAPASGLQLEGDMLVAPATERPGYAGYQFGVDDEETASNERTPIEDLPESDANGTATFPVSYRQGADLDPATGSPDIHPHGGSRRPRGRAQAGAAGDASAAAMIGVKPLFGDKNVAEGDKAGFRRRVRLARRQTAGARRPAVRTLEDGIPLSMVSPEFVVGL